jgi:hypothetical protein
MHGSLCSGEGVTAAHGWSLPSLRPCRLQRLRRPCIGRVGLPQNPPSAAAAGGVNPLHATRPESPDHHDTSCAHHMGVQLQHIGGDAACSLQRLGDTSAHWSHKVAMCGCAAQHAQGHQGPLPHSYRYHMESVAPLKVIGGRATLASLHPFQARNILVPHSTVCPTDG